MNSLNGIDSIEAIKPLVALSSPGGISSIKKIDSFEPLVTIEKINGLDPIGKIGYAVDSYEDEQINPTPKPPTPEQPDTDPIDPDPIDPIDPDPIEPTEYDIILIDILSYYSSQVVVKQGGVTYKYLIEIIKEISSQYYDKTSSHGLPLIMDINNFHNVYNFYGSNGNEESAFKTAAGWCISLILSELMPTKRTNILKIGYELGDYNKYSNIYGYKFEFDPNVMRIFSAAVYVSMRGLLKPNVSSMRKEIGGSKYNKTLRVLAEGDRDYVKNDGFFIDFREFMPTAPGPYAQGYTTRPDNTYPNEPKDEYDNLSVDRTIHEMIVEQYNLNVESHYQETVQAIADKETEVEHLFGDDIIVGEYHFSPVFGIDTIGVRIDPGSKISSFANDTLYTSSRARHILQSKETDPKQYGRLRPGCSWTKEETKHSDVDDRYNVLANFIIEDGDGHPTGYYDGNGNWVYPDAVKSPEEYEELQKRSLPANSYPSGHSSGICGAAMALMEIMPDKVDLILREMNRFAINRTIARYHWTSDTINGRVLGSAQNAVAHAASDYDDRLQKAINEYTPVEDNVNLSLAYECGGYGSCHVDAGENSMYHYCNKKCDTDRHPSIKVSQKVRFKIDGAGVKTADGKTSGEWEADTFYELLCPAVADGEEKTATITMKNENGVRILCYKLSTQDTHDDGPG